MSGQNYIGSKISLISLSDIRYVGILHNINPMESTVALQNVKSYGTEGRKGNLNEEIPASDNVFDYVVFRGSDIKDLQVFEAPPSFQSEFSNSTPQHDTAPYSSYYPTQQTYPSYRASYNHDYWQTTATGTTTATTAPASSFSNQTQQQQFAYHHQQQQPRFQMPVAENYQVAPSPSAPPIVDPLATSSSFTTLPGNYSADTSFNKTSPKKQEETQEKTVAPSFSEKEAAPTSAMQISASQEKEEVVVIEQVNEVLVDSLVKQVSDLDIKQPTTAVIKESKLNVIKEKQAVRKQQSSSRQKTTKESSNNGKKSVVTVKQPAKQSTLQSSDTSSESLSQTEPRSSRQGANSAREISTQRNNGVNNARRNSNNIPRNSGIVIPKADFDFASSNAKFNKTVIPQDEALGNENETVVIPEADHFYDKKKSFFDDISCESKEYQKRGSRTSTYKEESKLNLETFGQANPAGQNGKRHRHRSSRGRGRPQQRGGRNKSVFQEAN